MSASGSKIVRARRLWVKLLNNGHHRAGNTKYQTAVWYHWQFPAVEQLGACSHAGSTDRYVCADHRREWKRERVVLQDHTPSQPAKARAIHRHQLWFDPGRNDRLGVVRP